MHETNKNMANKSRTAHRHEPEWHIRRNHMAKKMRENAYVQIKNTTHVENTLSASALEKKVESNGSPA